MMPILGSIKGPCVCFFCNALFIHSSGPFQNGAKQRALVFYCSVHLHLFETPLNEPLFWAFDKKRHTHGPHTVWNFLR